MTSFVLDASVASALLLDENEGAQAEPVLALMQSGKALVPLLWHLEVRNSLLSASRRGRLSGTELAERLEDLQDLPLGTDSDLDLDAAFRLAETHSLSIYDAVYLELAKRHAIPIATFDKALSQAAVQENISLVCSYSFPISK